VIPSVPYLIDDASELFTPALAIYPEIVDQNIATTIRLLSGDPSRWRPHVKTAKLQFIMHRLVQRGIGQAKCSTTRELSTACAAGIKDVLLAYPVVGANALRVREIAAENPQVQISALAENPAQAAAWKGSRVGIFIDVNPGMNRTGIEQDHIHVILEVAAAITNAGLEFRGLHYYDGHLTAPSFEEREKLAHCGYDRLMEVVSVVERSGFRIEEVITSGTPAFPCAATYAPFRESSFLHRASPGTVVFSDVTSLAQLPGDWGYKPAAVVVSTVVSHPHPNLFTCDAGHKAVSADAGVPTCVVAGHLDCSPLKPSEEHLPIEVKSGRRPEIGDLLYLIPRHVCPTVNNFDDALMIESNRIVGMETVTARGHESPLRRTKAYRAREVV
jgi:D-serine deaminase-like pyridoxal phosphate-dependent protein